MGSCFPSLLGAVCYSAFVCHGQNKPGYKYGNRLRYSAAPFRSGGGGILALTGSWFSRFLSLSLSRYHHANEIC